MTMEAEAMVVTGAVRDHPAPRVRSDRCSAAQDSYPGAQPPAAFEHPDPAGVANR